MHKNRRLLVDSLLLTLHTPGCRYFQYKYIQFTASNPSSHNTLQLQVAIPREETPCAPHICSWNLVRCLLVYPHSPHSPSYVHSHVDLACPCALDHHTGHTRHAHSCTHTFVTWLCALMHCCSSFVYMSALQMWCCVFSAC